MQPCVDRGFVVYTGDAKHELLGVAWEKLKNAGAVSRDFVLDMATGALDQSQADIAVAITGFAGKGGKEGEAGLVHFARARRNGPVAQREAHFGDIDRGPVRIYRPGDVRHRDRCRLKCA